MQNNKWACVIEGKAVMWRTMVVFMAIIFGIIFKVMNYT